eukprot:156757_1
MMTEMQQTECQKAIECITQNLSIKYPQYPQLADKFKAHCYEEAYEEIDVLIDDFEEGFDESIILESITHDYNILDHDKQTLCKTIHYLLSTFNTRSSKPTSLNLNKIDSTYTETQVNAVRKLVSSQIKSLVSNNTDLAIFKVLAIGEKNNLPLLMYLIDMFHRWRLKAYLAPKSKHHKLNVTVDDFFVDTEIENKSNENMSDTYRQAIKACIHRNGICPLLQLNIRPKIHDSAQIYTKYCLAVLQSVNAMIPMQNLSIHFPAQIDVWIIPKHIVSENDETERKRFQNTDNLQTMDIVYENVNTSAQILLLGKIIKNVLNKNRKRMVMMFDRVKDNKDVLHAFLPKNAQNIPNTNLLRESMINLTKLEILPSKTGDINEDTINSHSDWANSCMFILSLHLYNDNEIGMYWHFNGSCSRFYVEDMFNLWPLYFKKNKVGKCSEKFDNLIDPNFTTFYEMNAANKSVPIRKSQVNMEAVDVDQATAEIMQEEKTKTIFIYNNDEYDAEHSSILKSEFWDICATKCEHCIQYVGKVICRFPREFNVGLQNKVYEQFMFGCSKAINYEKTEFKIKYTSVKDNFSKDAIGITTNIYECESVDRWITNFREKRYGFQMPTDYKNMVHGTRYVYWGGGQIWSIIHSETGYTHNKQIVDCKWKNGYIVTIQIIKGILKFFVHGKQMGNEIKISEESNGKKAVYYPIISTQCDDATFALIE